MDTSLLEKRAADALARFDPDKSRKARLPRPFMIEFFGTPKSGKSTMKEMLKHFFKRNGYSVAAPTEGAEVVEWTKRLEPEYNYQTAEYALSRARELAFGPLHKSFHVAIFDRAIFDGVVRMDYYREKGTITPDEHARNERYYLQEDNKSMFDLHVCLVSSPEVAIQRELARALTKKHGETMNPQTLQELLDAHARVWTRHGYESDPSMLWHDSSSETEEETAASILSTALDAFERRLAALASAPR